MKPWTTSLAALALCAASSAAPAAVPKVSYFPSALPQMRIEFPHRHVMLTLLRDDMVHVAIAERLDAGTPFFSPMVASPDFKGPQSGHGFDVASARMFARDIAVELDGDCWRIRALGPDQRVLTRSCLADSAAGALKLRLSAQDTTEVLGLGQQLHATATRPSWLGRSRAPGNAYGNAMATSPIGDTGNTQVPVAYVLGPGMRNYGMFFDTPYPIAFNFTGKDWSVTHGAAAMGMFVFTGPNLADLRRDYLVLTGTPPVPPLKAFGMWLSEYGFDNWAELDGKLATLRAAGFPIDGAVLDLQWFGGIQSGSSATPMGRLTWDRTRFPDARARLAAYAAGGIGMVAIEESHIGGDLPEHTDLAARRYLAMNCPAPCTTAAPLGANPWWGKGGMIDWSYPQAGSYWHDAKRRALLDDGIMGHWTDLGEPEQFNPKAHYNGIDWYGVPARAHRDVHNLYNFFWSQGIASGMARTHPARRPWILSRSGTAGSQRFGVAMWSGDVASSFDMLRAQMTAQANMSLSGFDYYGSDVGGFKRFGLAGPLLDKLYTRWFVSSALLEVPLRPHTENLCNCKETAPDRVGDRASNLAALRLRYRLAPYLYGLAHAAHASGEPLFPPLVYHFQDDAAARAVDHTKMIGPWLLMAGISHSGPDVDTYLPRGRWADFLHPERIVASLGATRAQPVVADGLVRAPLFLREGAIVPMLRDAPSHLGAGDGQVQWFADLVVRTWPSAAETRFTLVEDDGTTRAYATGNTARTAIGVQRTEPGLIRINLIPDNRTGATATRTLAVEVVGAAAAREVNVNGKVLTGGWAANGNLLRIELGSVDVNAVQAIRITL